MCSSRPPVLCRTIHNCQLCQLSMFLFCGFQVGNSNYRIVTHFLTLLTIWVYMSKPFGYFIEFIKWIQWTNSIEKSVLLKRMNYVHSVFSLFLCLQYFFLYSHVVHVLTLLIVPRHNYATFFLIYCYTRAIFIKDLDYSSVSLQTNHRLDYDRE